MAVTESKERPNTPIAFRYCDAKGANRTWILIWWTEKGAYICGGETSGSKPRTFRKDRVIEYLSGSAQLVDPFTPAPPRISKTTATDARPQILFTGFAKQEKKDLEDKATEAGLRVVSGSTLALTFLCCGPNAGWRKVERARESGSFIMTAGQLSQLLESGVLPDDHLHES
ncbi:BRCT domain-containing protein [Halopseudomonas sp.]|uniref:BRCT domain-containing protein n=1 Tax=Halopseudomonas sp. TaxID=2901191 RepID=UPI0030030BB0